MNRLCDRLGIRIPILQAPTGSIAGPELAAAVSSAGALGSMGLTWTKSEIAVEQVRQVREVTSAPFAVNFVLSFEPAALIPCLEAGVPIVTFSWGDPVAWLPMVRSFGARVGIQVGNTEGAKCAAQRSPDFIICQGVEAGGHVQSTRALESFLAEIVAFCGPIPVVAAGGIADGADVARVMRTGAQGAMLGTRFVATQESRAHEVYRRRILDAQSGDTALTVCFDGGWPHAPHRVLRNETLEMWEAAGCPPPGRRPGEGEATASMPDGDPIVRYEDTAPRRGMTGAVEEMALYCGVGADRIRDLPSAGELVARLWDEALAANGSRR